MNSLQQLHEGRLRGLSAVEETERAVRARASLPDRPFRPRAGEAPFGERSELSTPGESLTFLAVENLTAGGG
jgi:hypothetical protein